jgi:hypothetical protein
MREPEIRRELWNTVEEHPTRLTPEAQHRLDRLLGEATTSLAEDPSRVDEAHRNLSLLLDRAAAVGQGGGEESDVMVLERAQVSADDIESALRDLCPIFPFC